MFKGNITKLKPKKSDCVHPTEKKEEKVANVVQKWVGRRRRGGVNEGRKTSKMNGEGRGARPTVGTLAKLKLQL